MNFIFNSCGAMKVNVSGCVCYNEDDSCCVAVRCCCCCRKCCEFDENNKNDNKVIANECSHDFDCK